MLTGSSSEKKWVEAVPKLKVAGSNPVSRSDDSREMPIGWRSRTAAAILARLPRVHTRVHTICAERRALRFRNSPESHGRTTQIWRMKRTLGSAT